MKNEHTKNLYRFAASGTCNDSLVAYSDTSLCHYRRSATELISTAGTKIPNMNYP